MGTVQKIQRVKLIAGLIFKKDTNLDKAVSFLTSKFGPPDFQSRQIEFTLTDYYAQELGHGLKRVFLSFKKLIRPEELARIKLQTNVFEARLCHKGKRTVNIDPGYLELAKLILATTKNYCHRIYIGKGIYAEVTLTYRNNAFRPLEWTYPDYRTEEYLQIFAAIRTLYQRQLHPRL